MKKRKKLKTGVKIFLIITILLLVVGISAGVIINKLDSKKEETKLEEKTEPKEEPIKKVQVVDLDSNSRNIAVMINNIYKVWGYQTGIQDAYLVYEIIVEGGYTRLMAVYKDKDINRLGSIRSSRPYFLDYALENDAIYIHFGASNQALSDIKTLGVNNINFMNYSAGYWRDKSLGLATEHTAYTSTEKIKTGITKYNYRTTTNTKTVLNYSADEIDISSKEGAIPATDIYIRYSGSRYTSYIYDATNKVYLRSQGTNKDAIPHIDAVTKKQYTVKNIITYQVPTRNIDSYGRKAISNIGGGSGYYITNGYAIPITWEKNSRSSKTIYRYVNGEELVVNDGNTFIQIQPSSEQLLIK